MIVFLCELEGEHFFSSAAGEGVGANAVEVADDGDAHILDVTQIDGVLDGAEQLFFELLLLQLELEYAFVVGIDLVVVVDGVAAVVVVDDAVEDDAAVGGDALRAGALGEFTCFAFEPLGFGFLTRCEQDGDEEDADHSEGSECLCQLVGAGGVFRSAADAFELPDYFVGFLSLDELTEADGVAWASSDELDVVDDLGLVVDVEQYLFRTDALGLVFVFHGLLHVGIYALHVVEVFELLDHLVNGFALLVGDFFEVVGHVGELGAGDF